MRVNRLRDVFLSIGLAWSSANASATWSILLVDYATGEIAIASATCLTNFDLQANTPVLIPGVGAVTAQSFVDSNGYNRTFIRDGLARGTAPEQIIDGLSVFDAGHQTRQYGLIDSIGGLATFTGSGAGQWAGGLTGVLRGAGASGGDIGYAIQGNVLTGEVVVTGALEAIESETGDLPDKLLAGMLAARFLGGDGRCSCAPAGPTNCGPTPSDFEKSSDIAYFLVARDGDREGCSPAYRNADAFSAIESATVAGRSRLISSLASVAGLDIRDIEAIAAPAALGASQRIATPEPIARLAVADLTRDGLDDIVACGVSGSGVWLLAGDADEATGLAAPMLLSHAGHGAYAADLTGDGFCDLVLIDRIGGTITVLANTETGLEMTAEADLVGVEAVSAADLNNDGLVDLACVSSAPATLTTLQQQPDGRFTPLHASPVSIPTPSLILASDADRDGSPEILVGSRSSDTLEVFNADATPSFGGSLPLPSRPRQLLTFDLDGDGAPEPFVLGLAGSAVLKPFFPGGPLVFDSEVGIFLRPLGATLTDLDGDGDPDLAVACETQNTVRLIENVDGSFPLASGCGKGEFYLDLNVAFSQRTDPDPVDQISDQFEAWAATSVGVPDAVRSRVRVLAPFIRAQEGCVTTLEVMLLDRTGGPASAESVSAAMLDESQGVLSVGASRAIGSGRFELDLIGSGILGTDFIRFTANTADGPVELMPALAANAEDPADLDANGTVDSIDLGLWLDAYAAELPIADQNKDGLVNPGDFGAWVANGNARCP